MISVSLLLLFDAFWCLLAPFWHPWAPFCRPWGPSRNKDRGELGENSWSKSEFILGSLFSLFSKKSVLGCLFRRSVFCIVFWPPRGTLKPWKSSKTLVALHEIKDWPKSEKPRPEITFGSVLEVFLEPWSDIFAFFDVFEPSVFRSIFLIPKSLQTDHAGRLRTVTGDPVPP